MLSELNNIHSQVNFTFETMGNNQMPFLDRLVSPFCRSFWLTLVHVVRFFFLLRCCFDWFCKLYWLKSRKIYIHTYSPISSSSYRRRQNLIQKCSDFPRYEVKRPSFDNFWRFFTFSLVLHIPLSKTPFKNLGYCTLLNMLKIPFLVLLNRKT